MTTLIGQYEFNTERNGILFCIRNDSEKYYSDTEINGLMERLSSMEKCDRLDTTIHVEPHVIRGNLKKFIEDYFHKFSQYKVVITDRYHGTIFSLVANTPVIVIQTKDHKVKTGVDWFKGVYDDQVYFAENLDAAYDMARKIIGGHLYKKNSRYFEKVYYSKLREKVQG